MTEVTLSVALLRTLSERELKQMIEDAEEVLCEREHGRYYRFQTDVAALKERVREHVNKMKADFPALQAKRLEFIAADKQSWDKTSRIPLLGWLVGWLRPKSYPTNPYRSLDWHMYNDLERNWRASGVSYGDFNKQLNASAAFVTAMDELKAELHVDIETYHIDNYAAKLRITPLDEPFRFA